MFLYLSSIIGFAFRQDKSLGVALLLLAAFIIGLFSITLDPYLNMWDEQFHALVAKNMAKDMFTPILYPDPVLPYDYKSWTGNYIWLHKQPFFLWQMALAIKMIGPSVCAIRIPGMLCFVFATFCTYRIGKNVANQTIGFISALLFSSNYFFIELLSGSTPTDQNDVVFISYVTASIWAFSEYIKNEDRKKWIYLVGVFAGIAVLTKWLTGLLVYSGWFVYLLSGSKEDLKRISTYKDMLISFIVSACIFLPWQIYIMNVFPLESAHEFKVNSLHFFNSVEGHGGNNWFYYDSLNRNFGHLFSLFCFAGLILLRRYVNERRTYLVSLSFMVIVFAFFTIAATKMECFILIISSFLFIGVASLIYSLIVIPEKKRWQQVLFCIIAVFMLFINLDPEKLQIKHTPWKNDYVDYYERLNRNEWKNLCDSLKTTSKESKLVVFNCPETYENVSLMFYTDFIGYQTLPSQNEIDLAKKKGYHTAVIDDGRLPLAIRMNKELTIFSGPPYKLTKTDTVFIANPKFGYLSMFGEQLVCNDATAKEIFIIMHFSNGTCGIQNSKGEVATLDSEWKGRILFKKKRFTPRERFILESIEENKYRIKTADDSTPLKIINNGNAVCADDRQEITDDTFVFVKKGP
ncbi:MAG: glycosyltransferase family 39 protein [Bacteroidia bacterium]